MVRLIERHSGRRAAAIGDGDLAAAPVPIAIAIAVAAVDDVLVISVDAARDVAAVAVLARHAVSGAALPPDAPPEPLQHRGQAVTIRGEERSSCHVCREVTFPGKPSFPGRYKGWTPFSTPMFTPRGSRED